MTIIEKALERLATYTHVSLAGKGIPPGVEVTEPLAALIRAVQAQQQNWRTPENSEHDYEADVDCALIALCEAIAGEKAT